MIIFLTGFMGSGKTYLGKALADQLGFAFLDLDALIEVGEGLCIAEIFGRVGEQAFREMEARYLRTLAGHHHLVVATGGGAPCFFNNMDWMNGHGVSIYLHAEPALLAARLAGEKEKRPLLRQLDDGQLLAFIESKYSERRPFYDRANLQFDVPESGMAGIEALAGYLKRILPREGNG